MNNNIKIQIASDLHIERTETTDPFLYINPSADILVLAGDIGSLYKFDQLLTFLDNLCKKFQHVLFTPGNWEYYQLYGYDAIDINILINRLESLSKKIPNLHILNKTSVMFGKVCIAGCTLWSDLKLQIPKFIVKIPEMTTDLYKNIFYNNLKYIKSMVKYCQENDLKLVMVTHHAPSFKCISDQRINDKYITLYASEIMFPSKSIDTWICGHTHYNFDYVNEAGTRLISNQHGKPKDDVQDYKKNCVITINF